MVIRNGKYKLIGGWLNGLMPDPVMTVSEWADTYRKLPETNAEPGQFKTSRTPYVKEIIDKLSVTDKAQKIIWKKSSQVAAALCLQTKLPTPEGWTTMGDVKVGDLLFDERGEVCTVTQITSVLYDHECYSIEFSDGSKVIADAGHRWVVSKGVSKNKIAITTDLIAASYKDGKNNVYAISNTMPLNLEDIDLPIKPYLLGAWLGDGNSYANRITTHIDDAEEMIRYIKSEGIDCYITNKHSKGNCVEIVFGHKNNVSCKRGHILADVGKINGRCRKCHNQRVAYHKYGKPMDNILVEKTLFTKFKDLGISPTKHIPDVYKRSSINQRLELLRGLMDTDGTTGKAGGHCKFSTVSKELANDVAELITSLGLKPIIKKANCKTRNSCKGRDFNTCGYLYNVSFKAYLELPVFKLTRKVSRLLSEINGRPSETYRRRIIKVKRIESRPVKCISVDSPSHLYLCSEAMIPTHNTESGNNWLGYTMHISPSAMLYIMPTDTQMKLTSKTRIQKMIDATPVLREKIKSSRSRDSGNTMMTKEFMGGFVNMTGANSPVGLSSLPVQKVYCDEVDRYPADVCGEGDVISLAETRTSTFGDRRKMFITSTPTRKGESIIDKEFEKTGQRHWHVPCPHCGSYQKLLFEQLRYVKGDYLNSTKYECAHCKEQIQERYKTKMLVNGYWQPDFPEREDGITFGYHINALYSPYGWYSWAKMAKEYEEALDDLPKYIAWMNTKKGECHETEGDSPEWENIYNKREKYQLNTPNNQVIFITAGVDIQKDRIEVEIVGWGKGKQSWSIDYRVLLGNTESASNDVWSELGKIVSETWTREDGAVLPLQLMAVDSGNNTMVVYEFCRKYPISRVIPIKGRDNMAMMVAPPKAVDTAKSGKKIDGVKVWIVGVSLIKTELYGWLKLQQLDGEDYPNGYCHFPMYDETHFKSLTAERIEYVKNKKGYTAPSWVKHYERNERLDCRVYARAAANVIGIDRLKAEDWDKLLLDTQDLVPQKTETKSETGTKKRSNFW